MINRTSIDIKNRLQNACVSRSIHGDIVVNLDPERLFEEIIDGYIERSYEWNSTALFIYNKTDGNKNNI